MTTLYKTIKVPADRRVTLQLPEEVPAGSTADMIVTISKAAKTTSGKALSRFAGIFSDSATFARDALEIQKELRAEW